MKIKIQFSFLLVALVFFSYCKKDNKIPHPLPTSDFREQYTGTFSIIEHVTDYDHYRVSFDSTYYYNAEVSYKMSDSITNYANSKFPAIRWKCITLVGNDTSYLEFGIDNKGGLYDVPPSSYDGGFIDKDSINFYGNWGSGFHGNFSYIGKRIK